VSSAGAELLGLRAQIPTHIVYRTFAQETVMLNLDTGRYQGLNDTGGRVLDLLERGLTVGAAAETVAGEYDRPLADVERDVTAFCRDLADRGLIELESR
jgi:hypothetical protein